MGAALGACGEAGPVPHRVHVFGASGSGTTTLGAAIAGALGAPFLDADAYYWVATDPPFTTKRPPAERVGAIVHDVAGRADWVLSGSLCSWGDPLVPRFTLAVFLHLDPKARMARLADRERARYGPRVLPGGDLHAHHVAFMDWARSYDHARARAEPRPSRALDGAAAVPRPAPRRAPAGRGAAALIAC